MMDEFCRAIHQKICAEGGLDGYVILDEDDFLSCLAENAEAGELKEALSLLEERGCIDIRYRRGDTVCVAALKAPEPLPPPPHEQKNSGISPDERPKRAFKAPIWTVEFLAAFCGGALGSMIISLIFYLAA